jgi:hypothetical protein
VRRNEDEQVVLGLLSFEGLDDAGEQARGLVTSVRVQDKQVLLELDNGKRLSLGKVTGIATAPAEVTG